MQTVSSDSNTLSKEFSIISTLIELDIPGVAIKFTLEQIGYDSDQKIIQLLMRTSSGVDELYKKLLCLGYGNLNKDHIQVVEGGIVCVPIPKKTSSDYIPIYGKFMSLS